MTYRGLLLIFVAPSASVTTFQSMQRGGKSMFAVIMAGGKGARFWPRSRERMPKHLLDISSERTMIRETVDRIRPLVPAERTLIVTGKSHAAELIRQLPEIPPENILIEPVGRNTAPCIGLAALHILRRVPDAVMLVLPSDHRIGDESAFRKVLQEAVVEVDRGNPLVTIGIRTTERPETGYGYIEKGDPLPNRGDAGTSGVRAIREKPSREQAAEFIRRGDLWNSGMFVWKASTIMNAIERFLPDLHRGLLQIREALGTDREEGVVESIYAGLKSVSIDYGVMEKAKNVLVVPGAFDWSDLGSWDALWEVSEKDENGNVVRGEFIAIDAADSLIQSAGKLVALVGVKDLLVVETKDVLLVCRRGRSQDVRKIVETLEKKGPASYL